MGKVLVDMSMSLDGFIAGVDDDGGGLHNWYFGSEDEKDKAIVAESIQTIGSIMMGRRSYEMGNQYDGYVDNPYQVPHFILSHSVPDTLAKGFTDFTFVTDGVESLVRQAKQAAGDKDAVIGGGADLVQQCLAAGLVDEIQIHLVPILLGKGLRLFDGIPSNAIEMEIIWVIVSSAVTHIKYRVVK